MIREKIDKLISKSMLEHNNVELSTLRLIKNEFVKYEKLGKVLDDSAEIVILMGMVTQREDSIKQYNSANRFDLAKNEANEIEIIKQFLPNLLSPEELEKAIKEIIDNYVLSMRNYKISMKDIKPILVKAQEKYPNANGKIVSEIIKKYYI